MIAWPRWVLSAVTVSRSLVVKNAWNRWVSNRLNWPSSAFLFSSGMRLTTRRPTTRLSFFREVNAVKGTSATSALEIHLLVARSKTASV